MKGEPRILDPLTILGTLAGLASAYISYRTYQQQTALGRLKAEVDAYLEQDRRVRLLIVVRNKSDETVRLSRLKVSRPQGARFIKDEPDKYVPNIAKMQGILAPNANDAYSQFGRSYEILLPAGEPRPGTSVVVHVHCEFTTSVEKSGWVRARAILKA